MRRINAHAAGPRPPTGKSFLLLFFKKEELFFFEKKNQKTFIRWCAHG